MQHSTAARTDAKAPSESMIALGGTSFGSCDTPPLTRKYVSPCATSTPPRGGTNRITSESNISATATLGCDEWIGGMERVMMGYWSSNADATGCEVISASAPAFDLVDPASLVSSAAAASDVRLLCLRSLLELEDAFESRDFFLRSLPLRELVCDSSAELSAADAAAAAS